MGIKQIFSSLAVSVTYADPTAKATEVLPVAPQVFINKAADTQTYCLLILTQKSWGRKTVC